MSTNRFITRLRKSNGRLVHEKKAEETLYNLFKDQIPEGTYVDLFVEEVSQDGSLGQLARIHAMIRDLSMFTGADFDSMKKEVKDRAGLILPSFGPKKYKSFGDCSYEELTLAIQAAIQIGELVGHPVQ